MIRPDASIILPAFNSAATIEQTLRSVLAQRHPRWEAIVVDDGSHDRTAEIVARIASHDQRIHLIRQENAGAGAARNTGLAKASGEWIVFLDADDTLAEGHLARMMQAVRSAAEDGMSRDLLFHCGWRRRRSGKLWRSIYPARQIDDPFAATARGCPFAIHSAMIRRETILAAGAFDPALKICEDWDLWQRIARRDARFVPVSGLWADVHVTDGSLSSDVEGHFRDGLAVIRRGHAADPRVPDPDPRHAVGAPAEALPDALWSHALWMAGATIGRGKPWQPMLESLAAAQPPVCGDMHTAAAVLEDALVVGASLPQAPWPALWDQTRSEIVALFQWLETASSNRIPAERLGEILSARILSRLPNTATAQLGGLHRQMFDLAAPLLDLDLTGIRRLFGHITIQGVPVGNVVCAPLGRMDAADLRHEILSQIDSPALRRRLLARRPIAQADADWQAWIDTPEAIDRLLPVAPAPRSEGSHARRVADILAEEQTRAKELTEARAGPSTAAQTRTGPAPGETVDYTDEAYWEGIFSAKDPWDYRNTYEALKYDQTIDLLDGRRFASALEIACAEGEFTRRLAPLCDTVLATDIAPSAVERAAAQLSDVANVSCHQLDLLTDTLPGDFDLIVCSEVLYYLDEEAVLARFCAKVAEHLRPGGWFVTAHAKLTVDEPTCTGFGWPHRFGATGIGNAFAAVPSLVRDAELETPLYRIQRFRKLADGEIKDVIPAPSPRLANAACPLPQRIAEMVKWRGGVEVCEAAQWHDFPILMYHRIAERGPLGLSQWRTHPKAFEAQLAWLADNGWQGISFERMTWAVHWRTALPAKSVMFTFDDGTRDFLDTALPLLHRYGFPATLFVPTGKVGGFADWDAAYGDPAPILNWNEIISVSKQDVMVCSHGSDHVRLDSIDGEAILRDLVRSKAELETVLGVNARGIAYPFCATDEGVVQLARSAGYTFGFTCYDGFVSPSSNPLVLPRREVRGGISLAEFVELVGAKST